AIARLADGEDFVIGESFARGVAAVAVLGEQHEAALVETDPDAAVAVLKDGVGFVAGEPLELAVDGEDVVAQADEAVVGADPEIAFAVFEEAADQIAIMRVAADPGDEAIAVETCETAVGAGPDIAVAIGPHGANELI